MMNLSKKFLAIISFSFITAILLVIFISKSFILKSFNRIEMDNVSDDMTRVLNYINTYSNSIQTLTADYSRWDDTYEFMLNHNQEYENSNYNDITGFKEAGANFIIYTDISGNIVFSKIINSKNYINSTTIPALAAYALELSHQPYYKQINGLISVNDIPTFISVQPILKSGGAGPANGFIISGRFLDDNIIDDIYANEKIHVNIVKYDPSIISKYVYNQSNVYISVINKDTLHAQAIIKDIHGNPLLIAQTNLPRTIYKKANGNINLFIIILCLIELIASILLFLHLRFLIVRRILKIKNTVEEICATEDLSLRVEERKSDEISDLSTNFNKMFDRLQKSSERIQEIAYYDSLTQLPNRKKIIEDISIMIYKNQSKFAVFLIDLDNFKSINDSLGHDAGDIILKKTSERLKSLSNSRTMIGRSGGDEFIIVQENLDTVETVENLAKEICELFYSPIILNNNEFFVKASIGITIYPNDGRDISTLLKNADTAMYAAKEIGGSSYKIYARDMNENSLNKLIMENNLRKALDNDEFFLVYQPIFDCNTLEIVGAEVLSRWRHDNKVIPPVEFIPIAKNIGEIVRIDNWVLKEACYQCKEWQTKGLKDFYISVNISFKQLRQSGFVNYVLNLLKSSGLGPQHLNLEITEDEAMEDPEYTIKTLDELKKHEIKISIDDFGTGYSSLSYLNKLPLDTIKIDKSLINNLYYNDKNLEIVKAIITLAKTLKLNIVSEGIEHQNQLDILKSLKCKSIQGYLISKPVTADELLEKYVLKKQ